MDKKCYNCRTLVKVDLTSKTTPCPRCRVDCHFRGNEEYPYCFIVPNNSEAEELLNYYTVQKDIFGMWDEWLIITEHPLAKDNYRLAEMAFQMNWYQIGRACPLCHARGEDICGHLTFSRPMGG